MSKAMKFSGIALKNLFSKPATCGYPFVPREYTDRTRGRVVLDVDNCVLCGSCMRHCPSLAITVDRTKRTWSIQRMGCIQCADCVVNCPKNCLSMDRHYFEPGTEKVEETFEIPAAAGGGGGGGGSIPVKGDGCVYCGLCAKKCPVEAIKVDRAAKSWEVDEGSCVGCGTCVDSCPKKCLTMGGGGAAAPAAEPKKLSPEEFAAQAAIEADLPADVPIKGDGCVYCGMCAKNCPTSTISQTDYVAPGHKLASYHIDPLNCVKCGNCMSVCKVGAVSKQ